MWGQAVCGKRRRGGATIAVSGRKHDGACCGVACRRKLHVVQTAIIPNLDTCASTIYCQPLRLHNGWLCRPLQQARPPWLCYSHGWRHAYVPVHANDVDEPHTTTIRADAWARAVSSG